jgi:hypothetical protein
MSCTNGFVFAGHASGTLHATPSFDDPAAKTALGRHQMQDFERISAPGELRADARASGATRSGWLA